MIKKILDIIAKFILTDYIFIAIVMLSFGRWLEIKFILFCIIIFVQ